MNSNFYHDLDVESVLQCPVCYELPPAVIFLCKVGHHMCEKCRKRLTTCPTCQSALTGSRNFVAEDLISKFSIFKIGGDAPNNNIESENTNTEADLAVPLLEENRNELKALPISTGNYKCLLESCRNRKEMGVGSLFTHIESVHAHLYEKFQNKTSTFSHNFENFCFRRGSHKYHRAFHVSNMGIFFLNLQVLQGDYINCWISIPGPIRKANLFDYAVKFSKEVNNSGPTIRFRSKIASNLVSSQWLLERAAVFVIPPENHNLAVNDFFSLLVTIVYRAPST